MSSLRRSLRIILGIMIIVWAAGPTYNAAGAAPAAGPARPIVSATYYNMLPGFAIVVTGQQFTPLGRADVLIAEAGKLQEHDVVTVTAQGAFTDTTRVLCDFQTHVIRAYDRRSRQWSTRVLLGGPCPG